jgi:GxxExxY protein
VTTPKSFPTRTLFLKDNELTREVIRIAMKIHSRLGAGLLASAYQTCMAYELMKCGLWVEQQKPVPLVYEAVKLEGRTWL